MDPKPAPPLRSVPDGPRTGAPFATVGIFVILLFGAVHIARDFLLPVVIAILLFFVFMPLQRRLQKIGLPGGLVAGVLVLSLLVGFAVIFVLLSGPVMQVAENLPEIVRDITARFEQARDAATVLLQGFREGAQSDVPQLRSGFVADSDGGGEETDGDDILVSTATGALVYLSEAPAKVAQFFVALVLLFFMLSSSDLIYLKIIQSFDGFKDKRAALSTLREVERKLGGYLGTVTLVNAGLGVSIGLAMWALGMPVPLLFAVMAFLLNFIPYVGAIIGVTLATVVALLWFDSLSEIILVGSIYLLLTSVEGQFITPSALAKRLQMNRVLVFVSIAFWAWIWSFPGMLIAVPLLVTLRVISEQIPGWQKLANLLSGEAEAIRVLPTAREQ